MTEGVSDGELARLAQDGDAAAFRLLIERHQPMVRARARQLARSPGDVDDIMQESFLQAFLALTRLRDPDRFAGWLAGITVNVGRSHRRRPADTPLADWPEPLHPASAGGLPTAEELDRADALRTAVDVLPAGQRRAVTLHYYADRPAGEVGETPGAARASLHKARLRLRAYLTEHRPDLVPAPGRMHMTTVRVARVERRIPPGPVPDFAPTHVIVLADEASGREMPIWLLGRDSHRFAADARSGPDSDELTGRLLRAAGARVTAVQVDELGPEVSAARIELATPHGTEPVTVRLLDGLALAMATQAPIRVADAVMERLAAPAQTSPGTHSAPRALRDLSAGWRPRYEPRNLAFIEGLRHWALGGSFTESAQESHWADYAAATDDGTATLAAAVPDPAGFAALAQPLFADDYRGATVTFRAQLRVQAGQAGLFLRADSLDGPPGPATAETAAADPANHIVTVESSPGWVTSEVTVMIPGTAEVIEFGVFLNGAGRIGLRDPELSAMPALTPG